MQARGPGRLDPGDAVSAEHDVVVAGAGHNSLVAAAYLARAGLSVLVLEAADEIGGDTRSGPLALAGYEHDLCSTAHNLIQSSPTLRNDELGLFAHGLEYLHPDPVCHIPFPDGASLTMWRDAQATAEEIARFSRRDADAYLRLLSDYAEIAPLYGRWRYTPVGSGPALESLLAGAAGGSRWLRVAAMAAADVVNHLFEEPHVCAFLLWMAFMTMNPLERPGGGMLAYSLVFGRQRDSWVLPRGGSSALARALRRVIEACGGEIRTSEPVRALVVEGGRCTGVETASGEQFRARRGVLSTIHLKHLIEMAPAAAWGEDFLFAVDTWQAGIPMFVAHYATSTPLRVASASGAIDVVAAGTPGSVERMLAVEHDVRRGRVVTDDPVLLVLCPSVADPSRAPAGRHTLKVVGFQPYDPGGGPERWDEIKHEVAAANLAHLRRYAPGLGEEAILESDVRSPLDLERQNAHNWRGSCHGGDAGPAQSGPLRPAAGFAAHRMPIPGLYQTGATTHPGGSVSAGPGRNAAAVILEDCGMALEDVVAR